MAYLAIMGIIFGAELLTKEIVERYVPLNAKKDMLRGKVFLTKYHNEGAALNFLSRRRGLVAAGSVVLAFICTALFALTLTHAGKECLKLGLSLLLGGAYSNTYDRLRRKYVVDYLGVCHPKVKKPDVIYNLSDFCIMIGALLIVLGTGR